MNKLLTSEAFLVVRRLWDVNIMLTKHLHIKVGELIMFGNVQLNVNV